jgi:phytoene dehydrogenase-like protein
MARESYDAIVIGGGHNGLVAAAYLGRNGANTLVLEARDTPGGAATTETPWPEAREFKVTRLSYVMSLLPQTILNDLQLPRHGYKVFPMGPYYQAYPEGGSLTLHEEDSRRAYDEEGRGRLPALERLARRPRRRARPSATHAGGGVCGIPGMQAAKAAISDRRRSRSRRGRP